MKICIDEINRCRNISPSHYFMLLIGNRYGWIPIPETIEKIHWSNLKKSQKNSMP
ncbi:MAG: DUF4062 domain-containing protein [Rikenellaceae bacterium]|nr:DUF4062 domain-containing protein [Rikenellaceae bacterium]